MSRVERLGYTAVRSVDELVISQVMGLLCETRMEAAELALREGLEDAEGNPQPVGRSFLTAQVRSSWAPKASGAGGLFVVAVDELVPVTVHEIQLPSPSKVALN